MIYRLPAVVVLGLIVLAGGQATAGTNTWDKGSPSQGGKNSGKILVAGKAAPSAGWALQKDAIVYAWEALADGAVEQSTPVTVDTKTGAWSAAITLIPGRDYQIYVSVPQAQAGSAPVYINTPLLQIKAP